MSRIKIWVVFSFILAAFLVLNMIFVIISFDNYRQTRYHKVLYMLTDSTLNTYVNQFSPKKTTLLYLVYPVSRRVEHTISDKPYFSNFIYLDLPNMQNRYGSFLHKEIRNQLATRITHSVSQTQNLSVCYADVKKCVNFTVAISGRGYLYLLLILFSLSILLLVPIYFIYAQKLLKPFLRMQSITLNLGLDNKKYSIMAPFSIKNTAQLMNEVTEKIKTLVDEKLYIFSAISHDLRTPITKAKLYMQNNIPEIYHEKPLKYYADMEYLLNQISCYAKKSYHHEPRQKVDIVDFIESECHEYSSNHFDVTFNTNIASMVLSIQRNAFRRAIQNIIDNALKYAGSVEVSINKATKILAVTFKDKGPGIKDAHLKKIGTPFYRADHSRNQNIPGFGLGLSIVKEIIAQNKATLTIENNPDGVGLNVKVIWRC